MQILRLFSLMVFIIITTSINSKAMAANDDTLTFKVLRDMPLELGIDDMCCAQKHRFSDVLVSEFRTRYGESPVWIKFENIKPFDLIQLSPVLDEVTLYVRNKSSLEWMTVHNGDQIATSRRELISPFMALPLPDDADLSEIYVHIVQSSSVSITANGWSKPAFTKMMTNDVVLKVFLVGFILSNLVYNAFISALVRDLAFLFNATCMFSLLVLSIYLSGYGAAYYWDEWPGWSNTVLMLSLYCAVTSGAIFMWWFVKADGEDHRSGYPLLIWMPIATCVLISAIVLPLWSAILGQLLSAAGLLISALIFLSRRVIAGDKKSKILMVPFIFAIIPGMSLIALDKIFGVRFAQYYNNTLEMTFCLEAILFSLALVFRIRLTETATRAANERILLLRNENASKGVEAQDAERRRLAIELHDGVGQNFLVVLGNLKSLVTSPPTKKWKVSITELIELATSILDELRRISKDMHPVLIEHLGFKKAVEVLFKNMESSQHIPINSILEFNEKALSDKAQLHVYRIIQECLSNISRHSKASQCRIQMVQNNDLINLSIEDDGVGFTSALTQDASVNGLGLVSIDDRVNTLKGKWRALESVLGGVKIDIEFPLPMKNVSELQ